MEGVVEEKWMRNEGVVEGVPGGTAELALEVLAVSEEEEEENEEKR